MREVHCKQLGHREYEAYEEDDLVSCEYVIKLLPEAL